MNIHNHKIFNINVMFCELPKFSNVFCTEMISEENFIVCLDLSIISTFSGLTSDKISTECEAIISKVPARQISISTINNCTSS